MSLKGYRVGIIDLTRGELGTEGTADLRMQEAAQAAKILGIQIRENMDLGDCRLSNSFEIAEDLADVIRHYKPSILIAPYSDAHHPDHATSFKLAKKAAFFAKLEKIKTRHDAHRVAMVIHYMMHKPFDPSFVTDVTDNYVKKLEAIKTYKSR